MPIPESGQRRETGLLRLYDVRCVGFGHEYRALGHLCGSQCCRLKREPGRVSCLLKSLSGSIEAQKTSPSFNHSCG